MTPLFSIIVPLYQSGRTIRRTLKSVYVQTCTDYELIVIDNGSTDDGPAIVRELLRPQDRLVSQPQSGVSSARNRGAAESAGELLVFLDADDTLDPGFLDAILAMSRVFPGENVFATGYRQRFASGPDSHIAPVASAPFVHRDYFRHATAGAALLSVGSVAVRRSAFDAVGGFAPGVTHGEDLDLWARLCARNAVAVHPDVLMTYHRDVPGQATRAPALHRYDALRRTLDGLLADASLEPAVRTKIAAYRAAIERREILLHLDSGEADRATELIRAATTLSPTTRLLLRAAALRPLRPLAALGSRAARIPTSRRFLALVGGSRSVHGITLRIAPRP